ENLANPRRIAGDAPGNVRCRLPRQLEAALLRLPGKRLQRLPDHIAPVWSSVSDRTSPTRLTSSRFVKRPFAKENSPDVAVPIQTTPDWSSTIECTKESSGNPSAVRDFVRRPCERRHS